MKIKEATVYRLSWENVSDMLKKELKRILDYNGRCIAQMDDNSYWCVRFPDRMSIEDVYAVIKAVGADERQRRDSLPAASDCAADVNCLGMAVCELLLQRSLNCRWEDHHISDEYLWLLGVEDQSPTRIKLYQIIPELDSRNNLRRGLNYFHMNNKDTFPSNLYELVFDGSLTVNSPQDAYSIFNTKAPEGYSARPMTVSDVVEFIDTEENSTFYFCDRYGFTEIDFMPNEAMKPIRNHDYICETQVIDESVIVVFDDIDGYTDRFSKKVILSRCQYSDNQLGYMLQVLTDDKFYEICYLNRPKVLITKNSIPSTVLWKRNIDGFVERRYNEHDIQNLIAIEQWLRDENKWCYYL